MTAPMLGILGPLEVGGTERPRPFGGPRQRAVLIDLLIHANEALAADVLIDHVWDGRAPAGATTTLKVYASHLRAALAAVRVDGVAPAVLASRRPGYVLEVDPDLVDARRFERLVAQAGEVLNSDADRAGRLLADALALWRGPALSDVADLAFARGEATRLEELRLTALGWRIESDLRAGRGGEVIGELEVLVHAHPLHEAFRGQLMRALYATGRRAEALRSYRAAREVLGEELGIDPSLALQDLERAMLLQQLPVDLGPDPGVVTTSSNLPTSTTSFVGRQAELAEVEDLLGRHRLVSIVGEGGSGKTRLALEVARRQAPGPGRGPWLVELAAVQSAEQAFHLLASAIGVREDPGGSALEAVIGAIGPDPVLIVFDNCEHVVAEVAGPIGELVRRGPGVRVLATSRESLDVSGEAVWRIPTLALPPADADLGAADALRYDGVRLLVERAMSADSRFALTDERVPAIITICRRLDGMPLALELAAARLRVLSPEEVAGRLDDRFRLLGPANRSAVHRQRSLEAAVEWSYDLLSPVERLLFRRLSVFPGVFGLEHVEAVCAGDGVPPGDVVDLLGNLVTKSLVVRLPRSSGPARFRLLETLRHYAASRLGGRDEEERLRSGHAGWFTTRCEEVSVQRFGPRWHQWLERLDEEYDDDRAALTWLLDHGGPGAALRLATSLWRYWDYRYLTGEGRALMARALALPGSPPVLRMRGLAGAAYLAWMEDDFEGAVAACEEGLSLPGTEHDLAGRAALYTIEGEVARHQGDQAHRAEWLCRTAAELFSAAGEAWGQADAERVLALLAWDRGDLDEAEALGGSCLRLWESCGDTERSAGARSLLAGVARDSGDLGRAAVLYEESLAQFRQSGEPWGTAQMIRSLGTVVLAQGDADRAYRLGREGLAMHQQLGNRRGIAEARKLMGDAALALGDIGEAERCCAEALARFRDRGFEPDIRTALRSVAAVARARGDGDRADALEQEAREHEVIDLRTEPTGAASPPGSARSGDLAEIPGPVGTSVHQK